MIIFADRHHSGLAYSLRLMARRLNAKIYFPIGLEWFNNGFFGVAKPYDNNPDTIKQFLQIKPEFVPVDGTPQLNKLKENKTTHYVIKDLAHGDTLNAITFNQFLEMDIDVIIASIPDHWRSFLSLRNKYKPKAKVVCQMGNMFEEIHDMVLDGTVKNLMASTININFPLNIHKVFYHQEQPLREFKPPNFSLKPKITSLVNLLPRPDIYYRFKEAMPEFEFKAYGSGCPDGFLDTLGKVYNTIQDSSFIFHIKPYGDGFGWVFHSAYMLGRPVITNFSDYQDKFGGLLFEDKKTGLDLEKRSFTNSIKKIKEIYNNNHLKMCKAVYKKFKEVVNYNQEIKKIKVFFNNLV